VSVGVAGQSAACATAALCIVDGGGSVLEAIREYTGIHAGRMSPLPEWSYRRGAVVGLEGGTEFVNQTLQKIYAADVPVAGVWLQDWTGQRDPAIGKMVWYNWVLDAGRYPNWPALVASIQSHGGRVLTYANSFLTDDPTAERNLHEEASSAGYLIKDRDGKDYSFFETSPTIRMSLLDLSNPNATGWFKAVLREEVAMCGPKARAHCEGGCCVHGYMADYGRCALFS